MTQEPDGLLIGYARVSTDDQDLTLQRRALIAYGVKPEHIVEEKASGGSMKRKQLARVLEAMRERDTIVVWKLDRLGRSLTGVLEVLERIAAQGVSFVSITEKFDTSAPMGRAFLQMALVMAELERSLISERTKAGMAARKAAGARFGRAHLIRDNPKRLRAARRLDVKGELRDDDGELLMSAQALTDVFNRADTDPKHRIANAETVRRWKREGFPGLSDAPLDDPLDDE